MNRTQVRAEIHKALRIHPDGLTVPQLTALTGIEGSEIGGCIKNEDRMYIDRWTTSRHSHQWVAVWCIQPLPENAPRPAIKPSDYLNAMEAARV